MMFDFTGSLNDSFVEDVFSIPAYPLDKAVEWVSQNLDPEDVFITEQLTDWAKNNGFVEEE